MRLVGLIPCSDAFGVDLLVETYAQALKKNAEEQEARLANLKKTPEELATELNFGQDYINYSPKFSNDQSDEKPAPGIKPPGRRATEADQAMKRAQDQREVELNEQEAAIAKKESEL